MEELASCITTTKCHGSIIVFSNALMKTLVITALSQQAVKDAIVRQLLVYSARYQMLHEITLSKFDIDIDAQLGLQTANVLFLCRFIEGISITNSGNFNTLQDYTRNCQKFDTLASHIFAAVVIVLHQAC